MIVKKETQRKYKRDIVAMPNKNPNLLFFFLFHFFSLLIFVSQSVKTATRAVPAERGGPRIPIPQGPPPRTRNRRGIVAEKEEN